MSGVTAVGPVADFGTPVRTEVVRWTGPLAPLTIGLHHRLLAGLWPTLPPETPVLDDLFESLEAVLSEHADPDAEETNQVDVRLRMMLPLLLNVANRQSHPEVARVAERLGTVEIEARPRDFLEARAQTRRLALAVLDLVDLLVKAPSS
ncbi:MULTISPECIES: DUF6415 family natural product biosynthesis protein [unclassified Streptomyces]|uniref:DUF6415 family natural product biosynthesis protein n=1 Tax=unclassified Streptomyces TaxID=2593676 RepID=UPI00081D6068|nr:MULTISPECIES: DUF6415 family natural product biosynthesis protein [unclassified Streptomyces]MYZ39035.1 hypothetical protein [Streptomyces sp. SID4917]SCG01781.1 hypothetical protein GA0115259_107511 [Streptomyces sp. MnatMP-M17]